MILLLYSNFDIVTQLKPSEVQSKLSNYINRPPSGTFFNKLFSKRDKSKMFHGRISGSSFRIFPQTTGRNSFLPLIKGHIEDDNEGSRINIKLALHPIVLVLICAFILRIIASAIDNLHGNFSPDLENIAPYAMALGIYCMTIYFFHDESNKAKQALLRIFEGEIQTN